MIHSSTIHAITASREQEYLEGWQRARAELANLRTRLESERTSQRQSITRDVLESFLALADNFKALANHAPENLQADAWTQGVLHIARQFDATLESHGLSSINPMNEPFDPHHHEAIEQVESEQQPEQVVEVVQVGYQMGDQLLRPAKVKVSK